MMANCCSDRQCLITPVGGRVVVSSDDDNDDDDVEITRACMWAMPRVASTCGTWLINQVGVLLITGSRMMVVTAA